jgi:hypothetical protein
VGHHNAQNGVQRGLLEVAIVITAAPPLPVEIVNHTNCWEPYVPPFVGLLASLIVAGVAYRGVILSNRTNLVAITAADERSKQDRLDAQERCKQDREDAHQREFRAWKREMILRLGTEAMEAFISAHVLFIKFGYSGTRMTREEFEPPVTQAALRITETAMTLQLLGVDEAAELCVELSGAISNTDILDATLALNTARHVGDPTIGIDEATARFDEVTKLLASAQAEFRVAIQIEMDRLSPAKSRDE